MKLRPYKAILADLDGTMNRGETLIPGAIEVYEQLSARGIPWLFLSNNATLLAAHLAERINRLGIRVSRNQVLNSASALIHELGKNSSGKRVLVVGEPRLKEGVESTGAIVESEPGQVDIVVCAMDREFTYDKLRIAQNAIVRGARFWATNLDAALPVEDGLRPGAGTIVAAVSTAVGRPPDRVFGKPFSDMATLALEILDLPPEACLVVGDRMETDILFAKNAGMDSVAVLTGATTRESLSGYDYAPDHVIDSIADLPDLLGL